MCTNYICSLHMKSQQESIWRFSWKRRLQVDRLHNWTYVTYHWKYAYERHEIWCDKKASGDGWKRFVNARQRMPLSGLQEIILNPPFLEHLCTSLQVTILGPLLPWTVEHSHRTKKLARQVAKPRCHHPSAPGQKKSIHPSLGQHWALSCHSKCYSFFPRS